MEEKKFIITESQINSLLEYLSKQTYLEVYTIIPVLQFQLPLFKEKAADTDKILEDVALGSAVRNLNDMDDDANKELVTQAPVKQKK